MEKKTSSSHTIEKAKHPERKKIKLDRSGLELNLTKPSNGIKNVIKTDKKISEKINNEPKKDLSLKRCVEDESDDDIPLNIPRKLQNRNSVENSISSSRESVGDSMKKIKTVKSNHNTTIASPKKANITGVKGGDVIEKSKMDSLKPEGVKKIKSERGLTSPVKNTKSIKGEANSPLKYGLNKVKSESSNSLDSKVSKTGLQSPTNVIKEKSNSDAVKHSSLVRNGKQQSSSSSESSIKSEKITLKIKKEKNWSLKSEKSTKDDITSSSKTVKKSSLINTIDGRSHEKKDKISDTKSESSKLKVKTEKKDKVESKLKSCTEDSDDDDDDDDNVPLVRRSKLKTGAVKKSMINERKRKGSDDDDDDDYKPLKKRKSDVVGKGKVKKEEKAVKISKDKTKKQKDVSDKEEKKEKKGKEKKEEEVWKWWEEEKHPDGIKWLTLEHKGPYFPPEYEPLPDDVNFYYDGKKVKLNPKTEEVAGFYAKMLDHEYTSKQIFNDNFMQDWRKEMTEEERATIKHLNKCDFKEMHEYYVKKNEERKNMTKEEKLVIKEKNEEILQEYGYCIMDSHKERVGNFKIEPPGLFRGRGDHPKQGKLKKRLKAKDIIINIGKDAKVPDPPEGQRWKAVQHDNKVTWLACWIENIQGSYKYVMLNPTSRIKGEKDWQKYETARKLKGLIDKIREGYTNDWRSKEMRIRQRGVALYFIDKLALRAGHEKDEDTADTVGCCSLRYEHIKLHKKLEDKEYVVEFDFLGKDSIHYHNVVPVEKKVFKNLELFQQGKTDGDDLFDRLTTTSLNKHLSDLMEGLSAKVFRTYNASMTLQDQLNKLELEDNIPAKVLGYNRANRAVAILCNHQRSVPKTFEQSMSNLQQKIDDKKKTIKDSAKELKDLKQEAKGSDSATLAKKIEKKKTAISRLKEQLFKLEVSQTDKNENKEIALGTSKLNYLDPRISIAWCLKNEVPIEKIYNKTQRQKFAWAIDMTEKDFVF